MIEFIQKLGLDASVRVTGTDAKEVIEEAAFWAGLPVACPKCGSAVHVIHRVAKGFPFWGLECSGQSSGVQHHCTFGQHKDGGKLFYRRDGEWVARGGSADDDDAEPSGFSGTGSAPPALRAPDNARTSEPARTAPSASAQPRWAPDSVPCAECGAEVTPGRAVASRMTYGRALCAPHMAQAYDLRNAPPAATQGHGR